MTTRSTTVALVTPRYAPAIGGVELHVEMLARGLVRRGIPVEVVTTDPSGRLAAIEQRDGVLVRRFPTIAHDAVYFLAPDLGWWLLRNAWRFALLHAHSYHTPLALQAALAGWWSGTPLVLTPHYHGTGHTAFRRVLHLPYRLVGRWLMGRARRLICVSETEQGQLHRHFGLTLPTAVVPNGVDVDSLVTGDTGVPPTSDRPAARAAAASKLILAVGRLEPYKQTERLLEALPLLSPDYEVAIVGDGPARPRLDRLATKLGVEARVRMLGHLPRVDLLAWYRRADIFVSLSKWEAFGLTVLEAAVAGSAVVLSDIPAYREVASYVPTDRIAFLSPDCSPAELARTAEQAASRRRAADVENVPSMPQDQAQGRLRPLPTWAATVDGALACYRAVLGTHWAGVPSEVAA
jgi:glycosyltransferase involved in cell wall biosynthesis